MANIEKSWYLIKHWIRLIFVICANSMKMENILCFYCSLIELYHFPGCIKIVKLVPNCIKISQFHQFSPTQKQINQKSRKINKKKYSGCLQLFFSENCWINQKMSFCVVNASDRFFYWIEHFCLFHSFCSFWQFQLNVFSSFSGIQFLCTI